MYIYETKEVKQSRYTVKDKDFGKDEEKNISSPPVDLNRVITMDKIIPVVLQTPINSELKGKIIAVIESDIYASHGENILLPYGSKVMGEYAGATQNSRRIGLTWQRIITPDGVSIRFDSIGADKVGYSGAATDVDSRAVDRYGASMLVSLINTMAQISVNANNANQVAAAQSFAREMSNLTGALLKEKLEISPIISIRSGERLNIILQADIWIKTPDNKNQSIALRVEDNERI